MKSFAFWSPKKRAAALTLRKEGFSYREIASKLGGGATHLGVLKLCKKFEATGSLADRPRKGRKRISTDRDDRTLLRLAVNNRRLSSSKLAQMWTIRAHKMTILRRLRQSGVRARTPRKKPLLNIEQRRKRLVWAKEHIEWTEEQWKTVLWSDESKINLFGNDGNQFVWRRRGESNNVQCLVPTVKRGESVMVWGCMCYNGTGRLCIINGTVNAKKYISDILEKKMIPSARDLFLPPNSPNTMKPDFVFQQDNAPCHVAQVCKAWFVRNGIQVLDWPGNSPDLNPIENLWSRLKKLVAARNPSNKRQLVEALLYAWHHVITPADLKVLVASMSRRCKAVIRARGYPTKY